MESTGTTTIAKTAGLGFIAGMRSMAAPALVSDYLTRGARAGDVSGFNLLKIPMVASLFKLLAAGEMVGDKLPMAPARTSTPALLGRAGSGAIVGAALAEANGRPVVAAAALGIVAAVIGTFASYHLRRVAGQRSEVPDPLLGFIEDILVVASGLAVLWAGRKTG